MSMRQRGQTTAAFTLIEVGIVLLIVAIFLLLFVPGLRTAKRRALAQNCRDNLKMLGLAYRTWSPDSSDSYPQAVEIKYGGSKEWLNAGQLFRHFSTMSNELSTPKILLCPADYERRGSASFSLGFSNTNISYFVGLDAADTEPQTMLSGDRNLVLKTATPGILILTTNPPTPVTWSKDLHVSCGNVGLGDGSVQIWDQQQLVAGVINQGIATNRIVFP